MILYVTNFALYQSFFPILLVAPLVLLWESKTWLIKRYQVRIVIML